MLATPEPATAPTVAPDPDPPSRAKGKIADLPKDQRDLVNRLLDDGATYKVVSAELAKLGVSLNGENISNWFKGGYQEHLRLLEWRAEIRALRESAGDLPELNDGHQFQQTLVQLALTDIFRSLKQRNLDPESPNYIRLFHALARLNREALVLRQYDDRCAKDKAAQLKPLDPNRDLEKERDLMLAAMERAMGFKAAPGPIGLDPIQPLFTPTRSAPAGVSIGSADAPWRAEAGGEDRSSASSAGVPPAAPLKSEISNLQSTPLPSSDQSGPSAIKIQNSKLKNSPESPAPASCPSPDASYQSDRAEPIAPNHPAPAPPAEIENHLSAVASAKAENSKFKNLPGHCPSCNIALPPLLENGQRPHSVCRACGARLYPPGTNFYHCQFCGVALPILNGSEPPASNCHHCDNPLPPPGKRFVTHCPNCGLELPNLTNLGSRISDKCPDCRALLPLLEPANPNP